MTTYSKDTKGQKDLARLQNNELRLFSQEDILNCNISPSWKEVILYTAKVNSFTAVPSRSELTKKFSIKYPEYLLNKIEKKGMLFDFTAQEILNFYEIEPNARKDWLPKGLAWLKHHIDKIPVKINRESFWNEMKEHPRRPYYPIYFVANVVDERGVPCYESLGISKPVKEFKV